jgi:hypothetical protein
MKSPRLFFCRIIDPPGLVPGVKKVERGALSPHSHNVCLHRHKVCGRLELNESDTRLFFLPKK